MSVQDARAIPFGQRVADGRIVTASETLRGAACDCVCPECGQPLQSHQGEILAWHFQHQSSVGDCGGGIESGVHKFAKQIIAEKGRVFLPPLIARYGYRQSIVRPGHWARLQNVRVEAVIASTSGRIVPDIIAEVARRVGGKVVRRDVLIEVVVTHKATNDKLQFLRDNRLAAFEIHLRTITHTQRPTLYTSTSDVLRDAHRFWLWHPLQDEINAVFASETRDRELLLEKHKEQKSRLERRKAEHMRYYGDVQRRRRDVANNILLRHEISEYEMLNDRDIEIKRRERERWDKEAKEWIDQWLSRNKNLANRNLSK